MSTLKCEAVFYKNVLKDVSLELRPGRVCALLGPSGAGKSTLMWILAGLWRADRGKVTHDGGAVGVVFQQPGLWDHLTAEQHLKLVGASSEVRERVLEQMHLTKLRRRRPGAMSGGERQRLSIARALAVAPAWLLLDEPMAHLDGPTRRDLFDLLRDALTQTHAGVLLATHHADEALRLADDTAVLIDGQLAQHGPAHNVYHHPTSLAVACATGTASHFNGQIARPEHLTFTPNPNGDAVIQRCDFVGPGHLLLVRVGENTVTVWSDQSRDAGTVGAVIIKDRT